MSSNPDRTSFCILCGTWHFRDDVTPITLHSNRCLACMIRTDRANPLRVPDSVREMYEEALAQKSISWPLDWKD